MTPHGTTVAVTVSARDPAVRIAALRGNLGPESSETVVRELSTALLDTGRVLVDLSGLALSWLSPLQVFPSTLAALGGWPRARMVLFGAHPEARAQLHELHIPDAVPLVSDERAAHDRLRRPPTRLVRYHDLLPEPLAQRRARTLVHAACADWTLEDWAGDDAVLVATELVSNVIQHARTPCRLILTLDSRGLIIAVRDGRPAAITRLRPVNPSGRRGRGLLIVAGLARHWDITEYDNGKTVWALLTHLPPSWPHPNSPL
jgi:anti-sigma regulatory factor (Ser/Thr protein kinase)